MSRLRRPAWSRSLRFRLALRWSLTLSLIAAVLVVGLNLALAHAVGDPPDARTYQAWLKERTDDGDYRTVRQMEVGEVAAVEAATTARTLDTFRSMSGYALGGLFGVSLLVGWVLAGRALRPVRRMTLATAGLDARDLSARLAVQGDDELASLGRSIDDMLARLDDAFGRQRRFVDDASHELRTPLAVIRTNVDAVLSRPDAPAEEREQAVVTTRRAVDRMATLVDDLMASARASAPEEMQDRLRLDELARDEMAEVAVLAEARSVALLAELEPVTATGHEVALRRALDNLLANAVRLTPVGTRVRVASGQRGQWAFVAVTDAGPGLSEADAAQVFDRFWRSEDQDARDGHTGLGLSIVRQVAESHGGLARVHSRPGVGSTFVLWLPLHPADRPLDPPPALPAPRERREERTGDCRGERGDERVEDFAPPGRRERTTT